MANSYRNEISLKEMCRTLWKGKYIIAAFTVVCLIVGIVLSCFVVSTDFEATVYIDPSLYGIGQAELIYETKRTSVAGTVAGKLAEEPRSLVKGTTIESVKDTRYIKVNVVYPSREVSIKAAEEISLDILQLARDLRQERLFKDKERTERLLAFFDAEPLIDEESSAAEGKQSGGMVYMEMDPVTKMQLSQKAETLARLRSLNFELYEIMAHPDYEPENWIFTTPVVSKPVNKPVYIILSAFFGFALSCFIVLIRESWVETPEQEKIATYHELNE